MEESRTASTLLGGRWASVYSEEPRGRELSSMQKGRRGNEDVAAPPRCVESLLRDAHFDAPVFCPTCLSRIWRLGLGVRISLSGGVAQATFFQCFRGVGGAGF